VTGADFLAIFWAISCFLGTFWAVDFLAVCFVLAIVSEVEVGEEIIIIEAEIFVIYSERTQVLSPLKVVYLLAQC
jgi:hypothetical protein